ncbi:MAG TPA: hypothetical protein VFJ03_02455 [Candidatus Limnocylindria bacterium]|jgi:hypothetical protein|nr:hypothetical protein [Candidatus Limnocylindria bacterium]
MISHPIKDRNNRFGLRGMSPFGADRVAAGLSRRLDDRYHYFRHVAPGGAPPVEAVVVGPGGTWTLLRCTAHGRFRKRNGHWYTWNRSTESWVPWDAQPIHEARLAGHRLELYLERAALSLSVEAVLLVDPGTEVGWERDQQPGIGIESDLERLAARIDRDETLTPAQVDRIVALLDPRQPLPRLATSTPQG